MKNIFYTSSIILSAIFLCCLDSRQTVYAYEISDTSHEEEVTLVDSQDLEAMPSEKKIDDLEKNSNTYPTTATGERLRYNVPYYLTDKDLPNRGGVTYQRWLMYDYAVFNSNPNHLGTPIIFESPGVLFEFIQSDAPIIIRSVDSNWENWVYWQYTDSMNASSVWLSNQPRVMGNIYGSPSDNSVGLSMLALSVIPGTPLPMKQYLEFHGGTGSTAWMTARVFYLNPADPYPPVENRRTSFYLHPA